MGIRQSFDGWCGLGLKIGLDDSKGRFFSPYYWLAAIIILLLVACDISESSQPVERAEIIGRYRATYLDNALEYIILNDDGTYEHQYQLQGDSILMQTGTWKMIAPIGMGSPSINFKSFINWYSMEDSNCYCDKGRGTVDATPRGWGTYIKKNKEGVIKIERCPNERQYYILEKSTDSSKSSRE